METIKSILMIICVLAVGILIFWFRSWFYGKDGPLESVGMSEDDEKNLQKLLDRGKITQQEYDEAIAKLKEK